MLSAPLTPSRLSVLLDANCLWSPAIRDVLLRAAEYHLFRPFWTRQITDEIARNLKVKRPDLDPERIDRTIALMNAAFADALVTDYEELVPQLGTHPGDRHILAAAVRAGAHLIVTWNQAFPTRRS